jgi:hypothetical protein
MYQAVGLQDSMDRSMLFRPLIKNGSFRFKIRCLELTPNPPSYHGYLTTKSQESQDDFFLSH